MGLRTPKAPQKTVWAKALQLFVLASHGNSWESMKHIKHKWSVMWTYYLNTLHKWYSHGKCINTYMCSINSHVMLLYPDRFFSASNFGGIQHRLIQVNKLIRHHKSSSEDDKFTSGTILIAKNPKKLQKEYRIIECLAVDSNRCRRWMGNRKFIWGCLKVSRRSTINLLYDENI